MIVFHYQERHSTLYINNRRITQDDSVEHVLISLLWRPQNNLYCPPELRIQLYILLRDINHRCTIQDGEYSKSHEGDISFMGRKGVHTKNTQHSAYPLCKFVVLIRGSAILSFLATAIIYIISHIERDFMANINVYACMYIYIHYKNIWFGSQKKSTLK